jgi:hypothetical protein
LEAPSYQQLALAQFIAQLCLVTANGKATK